MNLLEVVVIVKNLLIKHYIVVIKNGGAWACWGGAILPEAQLSIYIRLIQILIGYTHSIVAGD
jgi:hypothetical protein